MNEKLIKDGKIFNIETSTLIAVSQWYTHYKKQRQKLYKTAKGTFFEVTEQPMTGMVYVENVKKDCPCILLKDGGFSIGCCGFRDDVIIGSVEVDSVLTEEKARRLYEYIVRGGEYSLHNGESSFKYKALLNYSEVFELTEA